MRSSTGSATSSSSSPPRVSVDPARVGRDGALALGVERRGAANVVTRCRSTLPLQVLAPVALDDPAAVVSVLNPTGGLLGGDRLAIEAEVGPCAHACLTTPSAGRVHRTEGEPAVQTVALRLGRRAILEWVPDHTIPAAGSAFRQAIDVELDDGATLILLDAFAAGRIARGEAWRFALLDGALRIRDRRGWLLHDRFVLGGGSAAAGLGFAEGHPYFATVALVADSGLERFTAEARRAIEDVEGARGGVAALARRGAVVRCLAASAPALTGLLDALWAAARRELLGLPPLALRKP
ncbi:MAG: urease accessory protein UreD [Candidatus Rokubacteria bacterium]|nr:urease accessory protein UreD [Candidatus Rokubacteria bacterium]